VNEQMVSQRIMYWNFNDLWDNKLT